MVVLSRPPFETEPPGVMGVWDPLSEGVRCEVKEVAAVEVRVLEGPPEDVVDDVSLSRLYPDKGGEGGRED